MCYQVPVLQQSFYIEHLFYILTQKSLLSRARDQMFEDYNLMERFRISQKQWISRRPLTKLGLLASKQSTPLPHHTSTNGE
jgi:hypothetical protein